MSSKGGGASPNAANYVLGVAPPNGANYVR